MADDTRRKVRELEQQRKRLRNQRLTNRTKGSRPTAEQRQQNQQIAAREKQLTSAITDAKVALRQARQGSKRPADGSDLRALGAELAENPLPPVQPGEFTPETQGQRISRARQRAAPFNRAALARRLGYDTSSESGAFDFREAIRLADPSEQSMRDLGTGVTAEDVNAEQQKEQSIRNRLRMAAFEQAARQNIPITQTASWRELEQRSLSPEMLAAMRSGEATPPSVTQVATEPAARVAFDSRLAGLRTQRPDPNAIPAADETNTEARLRELRDATQKLSQQQGGEGLPFWTGQWPGGQPLPESVPDTISDNDRALLRQLMSGDVPPAPGGPKPVPAPGPKPTAEQPQDPGVSVPNFPPKPTDGQFAGYNALTPRQRVELRNRARRTLEEANAGLDEALAFEPLAINTGPGAHAQDMSRNPRNDQMIRNQIGVDPSTLTDQEYFDLANVAWQRHRRIITDATGETAPGFADVEEYQAAVTSLSQTLNDTVLQAFGLSGDGRGVSVIDPTDETDAYLKSNAAAQLSTLVDNLNKRPAEQAQLAAQQVIQQLPASSEMLDREIEAYRQKANEAIESGPGIGAHIMAGLFGRDGAFLQGTDEIGQEFRAERLTRIRDATLEHLKRLRDSVRQLEQIAGRSQ